MATFNNILLGLKVQSQIPLDVKGYSLSEDTLQDLGENNYLAFSYHKGLTVFCLNEGTRWEWREPEIGETEIPLLAEDFIYPPNHSAFGVDYSNKAFNFFPYLVGAIGPQGPKGDTGATGAQGPQGIPGSQGIQGIPGTNGKTVLNGGGAPSTGIGTAGDFYIDTTASRLYGPKTTVWGSGISLVGAQGATGLQGIPGVPGPAGPAGEDAASNLQTIISGNPPVQNITDAMNNNTVIINNGATDLQLVINSGLMTSINVGFIQRGTGKVSFTNGVGAIIHTKVSGNLTMDGQNSHAYIEQITGTNEFVLLGELKSAT